VIKGLKTIIKQSNNKTIMSSNQINSVEQYAWVDEALENAWSQAHFEEEDEALNQETFGTAEESVAYIPMDIDENSVNTVLLSDEGVAYIPMDIEETSVSTISLCDEEVYDYEYDDFSVADEPREEEEVGAICYEWELPTWFNDDDEAYCARLIYYGRSFK
jgi:hypothetical protein